MSAATTKPERAINPRALDAVKQSLRLVVVRKKAARHALASKPGKGMGYLLLDYQSAFFIIPLLPL